MLGFSALSEAPISATAEVDDGSARAFVNLPTVNVTSAAPTVSASSVVSETGFTVTVTAPETTLSVSVTASVTIPEITVTAPASTETGSAISEAQAATIALTPAEAAVTGAAEAVFDDLIEVGVSSPAPTTSAGASASAQSNQVTVTSPEPSETGTAVAEATIPTVNVFTPTARFEGIEIPDALPAITVTSPEAQATVNVSAYSFISQPAIGQGIFGGFFVGIIDTTQANIIAADDYQTGSRYALVVSPKDYEGGRGSSPAAGLPTGDLRWDALDRTGQSGSFTRWNGIESTNNILAKNDTEYEVFEFIRTLRTAYPVPNDGGSDWYLPAMDELELLYRNLKPSTADNSTLSITRQFPGTQSAGFNPSSDSTGSLYTTLDPSQTSLTAFQTGGSEAIEQLYYWSSTDANEARLSWGQHFSGSGVEGTQSAFDKEVISVSVRPVRKVDAPQNITILPPEAIANISYVATAELIIVNLNAPNTETVISSESISEPLPQITVTTPQATAAGQGSVTATATIPQVTVSSPQSENTVLSTAQAVSSTITVSAPTSFETVVEIPLAKPPVIVISPQPTVSVSGQANSSGVTITVTSPDATASQGSISTAQLVTIAVTTPEASVSGSSSAQSESNTITVSAPETTESVVDKPALPVITITAPTAVASAQVTVANAELVEIAVTAPEAQINLSGDAIAPIPEVAITAFEAVAFVYNPALDRTIIVAREDRSVEVAAEDRDIEIAFENRTIVVT